MVAIGAFVTVTVVVNEVTVVAVVATVIVEVRC